MLKAIQDVAPSPGETALVLGAGPPEEIHGLPTELERKIQIASMAATTEFVGTP